MKKKWISLALIVLGCLIIFLFKIPDRGDSSHFPEGRPSGTIGNIDSIKRDSVLKVSKPDGYIKDYAYVDLGLPSGLKWAWCNLGASSPREFGQYFGCGDTEHRIPFKNLLRDKYYYLSITAEKDTLWLISKGVIDKDNNLTLRYDAANQNWGGTWRMLTSAEFDELIENTDFIWCNLKGSLGLVLTSHKNGKSIFLPFAGWLGSFWEVYDYGECGRYRTSTLVPTDSLKSKCVYTTKRSIRIVNAGRSVGKSIRAVSD